MFRRLLSLCAFVYAATAVPTTTIGLDRRDANPLSANELASFTPYTQFARAAYCPTRILSDWSCGEACLALQGFRPTLVGGDGNAVQIYFVGYWPEQDTIVVAHQGTDPSKLYAVLTDVNIPMVRLNSTLFPGVTSDVLVHAGFRNAHARTAPQILAEVGLLMEAYNTQSITAVGHSLGGALVELDALFLALNLPSSTVRAFTYGKPRVGNEKFAELVDTKIAGNFRRINNRRDVVPVLPDRILGFVHPEGEIHIVSPGNAVACSGNENAADRQCTIRTVPLLAFGSIDDHLGPYEGISIGTRSCT